ncbi:HEAT repeat-containing protein [Desulfomonile tiedjei DSM 6799]|uniref:HEAT repeat-containing protein n=1 Tax=Desulfomonile tiedjei (strain ATCC 49306 / DSM 6799 / DCB-1) TaxID=706587 RepID=I4C705_DESTA|nr:HEAT repeat domain-containing protein [Desulfomonile tiedjei]AFM25346.1 HEAT repeat-containing protein [Desulfomonile tiedjei DSM 6799]
MLKDPNARVRQQAAEAIVGTSSCPDDLLQPLLELLNDEDPKVVQAAIVALGRVGKGKSEVEESLLRFTSDSNPLLKESAVIALARLGRVDDQTISILLKTLESSDDSLRTSGVAAIGMADESQAVRLIPELIRNLETGQERAFGSSRAALLLMKDRCRQSLDRIVAVYEKVPHERKPDILKILIQLDSTGEHSLPVLTAALKDSNLEMRKIALYGMIRTTKDGDVLKPYLETALNDADREIQIAALRYLHAHADKMPDLFPKVLALTKHDKPQVRMAAVNALVPFKAQSSESFKVLNDIVQHDSDPQVRANTCAALARMDLDWAPKILPLLEHVSQTEEDAKPKDSAKAALKSLRRRLALDRDTMIPGEELGR